MIVDGLAVRLRQIRYDSDVDAILEQEQMCRPNAWSRRRFEAHREHGGYCLLATHPADSRKIVGHVMYSRMHNITSVFRFIVRPGYRRQGVGSRMLRHMVNKGGLLSLVVWEKDLDMQVFLRNRGFVCEGIHARWFRHTHSDGYIFSFGE